MVKRIGNILTFLVLVALLLLNSTSREFIHTFTGHQDTIDHICHSNHTDHHAAFDPEHHHCDFLQYVIPVYQSTQENFQVFFIKEKVSPVSLWLFAGISDDREQAAVRGPPLSLC